MLNAKWNNTPMLLEVNYKLPKKLLNIWFQSQIFVFKAAEFLASESKDYFWRFISDVGEVELRPFY